MKAFTTLSGSRYKPIDVPGNEVDALMRVYCNYLEEILEDINALMKKERGE